MQNEKTMMTYEEAKNKVVGCYTLSIRNDWSASDVESRNSVVEELYGSCIEDCSEDGRCYRNSEYPYCDITPLEYLTIKIKFPSLWKYLKDLGHPQDKYSHMYHLIDLTEVVAFDQFLNILNDDVSKEAMINLANTVKDLEINLVTEEGIKICLK
jgi:hypothetical protein